MPIRMYVSKQPGLRSFALTILCLPALLTVSSCGSSEKIEGDVVSKAQRPGGGAVAIVTLTGASAGATVGFGNNIYIQGAGPDGRLALVARLYRNETPRIAWTSRDHLTLSLQCGKIWDFTNDALVHYDSDKGVLDEVTVTLENGGLCEKR